MKEMDDYINANCHKAREFYAQHGSQTAGHNLLLFGEGEAQDE